MKFQLYPFLAERILASCGLNQLAWSATLTGLAGIPIQLPNFFWDVENVVAFQRLPKQLKLEILWPTGWEPLVFEGYLDSLIERRLRRGLITTFCRERNAA